MALRLAGGPRGECSGKPWRKYAQCTTCARDCLYAVNSTLNPRNKITRARAEWDRPW